MSIILACLLSVIFSNPVQQDRDQPELFLDEENIDWRNFPAISQDGSKVLVIYTEYSCCLSRPIYLRMLHKETMVIEEEVLLYPGETSTPFSLKEKKASVQKANSLLNETHYTGMTSVERIPDDEKELDNGITFSWKGATVAIDSTIIPSFDVNGHCCELLSEDESPCSLKANQVDGWAEPSTSTLLLSFSHIAMADGCDRGPVYKTVSVP